MSNMEVPFELAYEPIYEDKITRLNKEEFFSLFEHFNAAPRWVNSGGKRSIQILGLCHHGENHSALFDPTTLKVNCFSECVRRRNDAAYMGHAVLGFRQSIPCQKDA